MKQGQTLKIGDFSFNDEYYVDFIATFKRFCNKGVASALLASAVKSAKKAGLSSVSLLARSNDKSVLKFYQNRGFNAVNSGEINGIYFTKMVQKI
ncbi:GNAT family N-acetyltransferase [Campylobacter sp. 19-13652]|uniref:GNAT family N-acetyltransferase n=1 Tax=Campylobacter sp. 19-13652 TaxID=2840180 RepID=UPI001C8506C4